MQAFHFHGNWVHDITHNVLILVLMVQQFGFDTTMTVLAEIVRRHA